MLNTNIPLKMHARKSMNLFMSSAHSVSGISPSGLRSAGLSPRFPRQGPSYFESSAPPSPGLPSLIPRHGKKATPSLYRRFKRVLLILGALVAFAWVALQLLSSGRPGGSFTDQEEVQYEMVGDSPLPSDPSVVMLTDNMGKARWTVSIPPKLDFPLKPDQYKELCGQAEEMSLHIAEIAGGSKKQRKRLLGYYGVDPNFMEVVDAENQGLLGYAKGGSGEKDETAGGLPRCERTLTYVMETSDAGMGNSLMGLWMAYGLAQKEGRTFFVDDTRWPYGNYTSYFRPVPAAHCAPAPPSNRVPCPHTAAHIIVAAATFPQTFGNQFTNEFLDAKKTGVEQQAPIYELARRGYEALFHLADPDDLAYLHQRKKDIMVKTKIEGGMTIGLHVRRGDRHPWEYQYSGDYIPLINYMDEARQVLSDRYEHDEDEEEGEGHSHTNPAAAASPFSNIVATAKNRILAAPSKKKAKTKSFSKRKLEIELSERHGPAGMMLSKVLLASDDPDVHDSPEVSRTLRAQDRIMLASKRALENAQPGTKKNDWIDEIHGWEGGFYRDVFWGLGQSGLGASSPGSKVSEGAMQLRRMIGRAYVLDLAVLGEADTVVCGVSAMGCRLLAVMMGWERGIVRGGWRNVDGAFEWKGLVW